MSDYSGDRKELWSEMLHLVIKMFNYYANGQIVR